jgi:hypothetical protein
VQSRLLPHAAYTSLYPPKLRAGYKPWLRLRNAPLLHWEIRLLHWKLRVYRRAGCRLYRLRGPACSCAVEYMAANLVALRRYHYRSTEAVYKNAAQVPEACKTASPAEVYRKGAPAEETTVPVEATTVPVEATTAPAEENI